MRRRATLSARLAVAAARVATDDAKLSLSYYPPHRTGVVMGTALGGWLEGEQQGGTLREKGLGRVNPFLVTGAGPYSAGVEVAAAMSATGPHATISSGCVSSLQAIAQGASMVESGEVDVCFAGGTETPITPTIFAALSRTSELSRMNDVPKSASRPFDAAHDGMVLSEGSCILVLESLKHVVRRRVSPYAVILGSSSSCDARGMYAFDESGEPGARAIHLALGRSLLSLEDVDYVCSHANSSPVFDRKDTLIIKRAFGEVASNLPISSIKSVLGHPFGASGAFQVAAAALAILHQVIPPTHNLDVADPVCDLDYVPNHPRKSSIRIALVTNYGYGGLNSYLLLARPPSP
jgi:3-oxoacyl-[acyl-carrier-protein] synthase II